MKRFLPYALLLLLAVVVIAWQALEHNRVRAAAGMALADRARDVAASVSVVFRAQGRFGWVHRERIEAALEALIQSTEPIGVALLDMDGEVSVMAGEPLPSDTERLLEKRAHWQGDRVTFVHVVALGPQALRGSGPPPPAGSPLGAPPPRRGLGEGPRDGTGQRAREFRRPPWMAEREFSDIISARGVHWFVITLPTETFRAEVRRDLGLRVAVALAALFGSAALGLAWRSLQHGADLRVRLARADELNRHMRDLNLAAAGLVHETKNPLNVIRGLAQVMDKTPDVPDALRQQAAAITEESDRVAGRLNLFLDYARPLAPEMRAVPLQPMIEGVAALLAPDLDDKRATLDTGAASAPTGLTVLADPEMLRQILFNLLLNAVQAVPTGGHIAVTIGRDADQAGWLEVHDNGPGVPLEQCEEVFRPYFTTRDGGTGLGLAIVRHIALAHGWEAHCMPSADGARFRIRGMRAAGPNA